MIRPSAGTITGPGPFTVESGRIPARNVWGVCVLFGLIWHAIYLVTFVASLYALIEAIRTPAAAFELMDKQTKKLWVILTGVATGLSLLATLSGSGMFVILGLVATLVFLLDVRPAVKGVGGNRNNGPYGPW